MTGRWMSAGSRLIGCALLFALTLGAGVAVAQGRFHRHRPWPVPEPEWSSLVEVTVIDDAGREFAQYPSEGHWRDTSSGRRVYLEARRGERYAIAVRNLTGERLAVGIAVDGRNIITGDRSYLVRANESMYLIGPHETRRYTGWRTGADRVNRFYFTSAEHSYAGAWGSAADAGIIAVAVFREQTRTPPIVYDTPRDRYSEPASSGSKSQGEAKRAPAGGPPAAMSMERDHAMGESRAGTGYGETDWSPSREVEFDPQTLPAERWLIRYEWTETLERMGIIRPRHWHRDPWRESPPPDQPFVPPPPRPRW